MGFSCLYEVRVFARPTTRFTGASYSHMTESFDLHQRCVAVKVFFSSREGEREGVAMMKKLSALGMIAAAALFCAVPLSLHWSAAKSPTLSFDTADARIGRPLTPGSVAGVNRRVHRRAYRRGAYYGAAAVGAAAYGYHRRCAGWRAGVCVRWY